jgi:hypothetical protein
MGGAMKSMLAKQTPQRSPWLPMRVRQEMQTGGRRRSARRPRMGRMMPAAPRALAGGASRPSSVPQIAMSAMIEPEGLKLKARSRAIS